MKAKLLLVLFILSLSIFTFLTYSYIKVAQPHTEKAWSFHERVTLIVYPKEQGDYTFTFTSTYHGHAVILLKLSHSHVTLKRNVITLATNSTCTLYLHPGDYVIQEYVVLDSPNQPSSSSFNISITRV